MQEMYKDEEINKLSESVRDNLIDTRNSIIDYMEDILLNTPLYVKDSLEEKIRFQFNQLSKHLTEQPLNN